jgi:hypothetical protein
MNLKRYAADFALVFCVTLVASAIVTYLYNLIAHGHGIIEWDTAFRQSFLFGFVLPWLLQRQQKKTGS